MGFLNSMLLFQTRNLNYILPICSYPNEVPFVKFVSKVFHPQISSDGKLKLSHVFSKWNSSKNFIYQVLIYLKRIFYEIQIENAANEEAAQL
jgi:ubiquitin-protein ligase